MSQQYSIAEAKNRLPRLVHEAEAGTVVEITRRGHAVAVLLSTAAYERLTSQPSSLWLVSRELRPTYAVEAQPDDDPFGNLRDPAPGRDVEL